MKSNHSCKNSRHRTCWTQIGPLELRIRNVEKSFRRIFFTILLTILFIHTLECTNIEYPSLTSPWVSNTINGRIDNIISDEKINSVFIVVKNYIYKYNATDLSLLLSTLPSNTTSNQITNETNTNLANKLLFIQRRSDFDLLSSCWAKSLGLYCLLFRVKDLKAAPLKLTADKNQRFFIDTNENLKVLVDSSETNNLLLTTSRLEDVERSDVGSTNGNYSRLPAIGRFRIIKDKNVFIMEQISVLPYASLWGYDDLFYDYIHSFNYGQYTHFVLNDIRKLRSNSSSNAPRYSVRLARVCKNDTELTSYTEIPIMCKNHENLYAKVAHLVENDKDPQLYIVFEAKTNVSPNSKKSTPSTYICSYSMRLITDIYHRAISDCNNAHQASEISLLDKIHSEKLTCSKNPSKDWCLSKTNLYIDGTSIHNNVDQDYYIELNGVSGVNFFHVVTHETDSNELFFMGTESGLLTKLLREGHEDIERLYTINLNHHNVSHYTIEDKITENIMVDTNNQMNSTYVINSGRILATSSGRNELHSIDIDSCQHYNSCRACTLTRDPLDCTWCGGICSKRIECYSNSKFTSTCPPVIRDFAPKVVPITGSTKLTITGENFGSSKGMLNVKLGDQECTVDKAYSSSEKIVCYTNSSKYAFNATITIEVDDETKGPPDSKGSTTSVDQLHFVEVKLFGLDPESKPINGAILLYGDYLNSGFNRSLLIGDSICDIITLESFNLSCRYEKPINQSEMNKSLPLKLIVDGHEQKSDANNNKFSLNFEFTYDMFDVNDEPINNATTQLVADGSSIGFMLLLIILIAIIILFALFFAKFEKISRFKLPPFKKKSNNDLDQTKVSFRNPHSNKFGDNNNNNNNNSNSIREPLNGIVKFDSINNSSDYFGKPNDHLELDKPLINSVIDEQLMTFLANERILIDRNRLTLGHVLGSGQFGRVYKGFLHFGETGENVEVAVKTLHSRCAWDDSLDSKAFLDEGLMMRDFEHENVLALIGVTFDSSGSPMVITPFMLYGDLRSYISDEASSPTVKELIEYGIQIARGMAYLSNMKFVHRDLAARNCMLDENLTVKVADFGLSRDIYERDYYSSDNKKAKLPVKWMAIESLEKSIYSTKSDVWSYGVVLWELMTRGVVPYPDVDNFDLFSYLKEGRRMLRPRYCPVLLYNIMSSCWSENPALRPSFDELVESVSSIINQLRATKDNDMNGQQKVSRDETYCDVLR